MIKLTQSSIDSIVDNNGLDNQQQLDDILLEATGQNLEVLPEPKTFTDGREVLTILNDIETKITCMVAEGQEIAKDSYIAQKAEDIHNFLQKIGY